METGQEPQTVIIKVGRDRVTISDQHVLIDARHPMPDWQVREFARIPIYFRDVKYFLRAKEAGEKPYALRYTLDAWPEDNHETCRTTLDYNEEVVAQRDAAVRGNLCEGPIRAALLLIYPLLGLLWSDTKDKLSRFSIAPRTVTGVSNFIIFGLLMVDGIFAQMLMVGSMKTGKLALGGIIRTFADQNHWTIGAFQIPIFWLDCAVFAVLVLDLIIRFSHHIGQTGTSDVNLGFCEWLKFPFQRKKEVVQPVGLR